MNIHLVIKKSFLLVINFINSIYPKSSCQMTFISYPDLSDNSFALFKYILESLPEKYTITWLIHDIKDKNKYIELCANNINVDNTVLNNILFVNRLSIYGLLQFVKSKYVFFTHGIINDLKVSKNQILVNVWHGMPVKTIGGLASNDITACSYAIATSTFYQKIMAKAFHLDTKNILLTGQPRCDLLLAPSNCLKNFNISKSDYSKIIFWAPTYRRAKGINYNDDFATNGFSIIDLENLEEFNTFLKTLNTFLFIKLHPLDILNDENFNNLSNIMILKSEDLLNHNCQLYSLLAEVDILLTDFSSIYIDFLLTQKPIFFVVEDSSIFHKPDYIGSLFDDPISLMPGKIIDSYSDLQSSLTNLIVDKNDPYQEPRKKVNEQFNNIKKDFSKNLVKALKI